MDLQSYNALVATAALLCILGEWTYVILSIRGVRAALADFGGALVASVTQAVMAAAKNLRAGRGKGRTVVETVAEEADQEPEPTQLAIPGAPPQLGQLLAGIDPRAIQQGYPLLQKFMSGAKLSPAETVEGIKLLGYFAEKAKTLDLSQLPSGPGGSVGASRGSPAGGWE